MPKSMISALKDRLLKKFSITYLTIQIEEAICQDAPVASR